MKLYERLGFLRSKRLHRYYLNGNTAFRLVLYLKESSILTSPMDSNILDDKKNDDEHDMHQTDPAKTLEANSFKR